MPRISLHLHFPHFPTIFPHLSIPLTSTYLYSLHLLSLSLFIQRCISFPRSLPHLFLPGQSLSTFLFTFLPFCLPSSRHVPLFPQSLSTFFIYFAPPPFSFLHLLLNTYVPFVTHLISLFSPCVFFFHIFLLVFFLSLLAMPPFPSSSS